jgi:hypothetical protein
MESAHLFRSTFSLLHVDLQHFLQSMAPELVYKNDTEALKLKHKQISRKDLKDNYDLRHLMFPCIASILSLPNFLLLHHPLLSYFWTILIEMISYFSHY